MENFRSTAINGCVVEVNSSGTVVKVDGKTVNQFLSRKAGRGEPFYQVSVNGKAYYVHRLVAELFVPNPDNKPYAVHMNTNTRFNDYRNLCWGDQRLIAQNMKAVKRLRVPSKELRTGSKIPNSEVLAIVSRLNAGEKLASIALDYNTSDMTIHRIKKRYVNLPVK